MSNYYRSVSYAVVWLSFALVLGYIFARYSYDVQGALLVIFALLPIGFVLIRMMAKAERSGWFLRLLVIALVLKLAVSLFRLVVYRKVFGGLFDTGRYHDEGMLIAQYIWHLDFAPVLPNLQFGTPFIGFYVGLVYAIIGPTLPGAYLVFSLLAFVGSFFFYRAFCVAFPYGDRRLYAIAAFLLPSLLYWPNGVGKDALMALFIGLTAYGTAHALSGNYIKGLLPLSIGLLGAVTVRPYMAGILAIALVVAFVFGGRKPGGKKAITYIPGVVVAGVLAWFLVSQGIQQVGLSEFSPEAIQDYIAQRQESTFEGGSKFTPPSVADPVAIPMVVATVLIRPFPWEAHNLQAFVQAADGFLLLALVVWRIRSLGHSIRAMPSAPLLLFIFAYMVLFFPAFTTISNFGTLARERAMLLPLFLMLLAFRPPPKKDPAANLVTV